MRRLELVLTGLLAATAGFGVAFLFAAWIYG